MKRTIEEWKKERQFRLSPRIANQALMDLLWEDLPEILEKASRADAAEAEVERLTAKNRAMANEVERDAQSIRERLGWKEPSEAQQEANLAFAVKEEG